jgi:peptide/nickel transport system substrate-binding protein
LTKAEGTIDIKARSEIIGKLEKIMQEDGPIAQPLWRSVYAAYDKRVKGFEIHPTLYIFGETIAIDKA